MTPTTMPMETMIAIKPFKRGSRWPIGKALYLDADVARALAAAGRVALVPADQTRAAWSADTWGRRVR